MALIVDIPSRGRRITVASPQRISFGRNERARVTIPEDTFLSGIHFVLAWDGGACKLENLGRNGTLVNGQLMDAGELRDGDRLRAGDTEFLVGLGRPSGEASGELIVGGWSLAQIPPGWELLEGAGLRRLGAEPRDNIVFSEDDLPDHLTLAQYVESQRHGAAGHYEQDVVFEPWDVQARMEVDESTSILFRPPLKIAVKALQQQTYVRVGERIGIVTITSFNREKPYGLPPGLDFRQAAPEPPKTSPDDTMAS
ncbi:MAG: FHA domain-containing protein [Acidobacteria bacterium]|nr:FHA domain-containing protein [Acidobacteriota bacterium]